MRPKWLVKRQQEHGAGVDLYVNGEASFCVSLPFNVQSALFAGIIRNAELINVKCFTQGRAIAEIRASISHPSSPFSLSIPEQGFFAPTFGEYGHDTVYLLR